MKLDFPENSIDRQVQGDAKSKDNGKNWSWLKEEAMPA